MKQGKLIVLSAPSGSGKTTIVRHLLAQKELELEFSISATSRQKRENEVNNKDYYFLSLSEFKKQIKAGNFIEWEEVYAGLFYGTLKSEINRIWKKGKHVIFDIDVEGGLNIKKRYPEQTLALFIKPPNINTLRERLQKRNTETEDKIAIRLEKADSELSKASLFDSVIENDKLEVALATAYNKVSQFINN